MNVHSLQEVASTPYYDCAAHAHCRPSARARARKASHPDKRFRIATFCLLMLLSRAFLSDWKRKIVSRARKTFSLCGSFRIAIFFVFGVFSLAFRTEAAKKEKWLYLVISSKHESRSSFSVVWWLFADDFSPVVNSHPPRAVYPLSWRQRGQREGKGVND